MGMAVLHEISGTAAAFNKALKKDQRNAKQGYMLSCTRMLAAKQQYHRCDFNQQVPNPLACH